MARLVTVDVCELTLAAIKAPAELADATEVETVAICDFSEVLNVTALLFVVARPTWREARLALALTTLVLTVARLVETIAILSVVVDTLASVATKLVDRLAAPALTLFAIG